jgi:hypothetical protein
MYRYFFRFAVTSISILTATLFTTAINEYLISYKYQIKPVTFTFIGMAIIVVVFYPLFIKLENWIKKLSAKVMRSGKSLAGKYLGLILTFIFCLLVLGYFYAKMWYHIDFLRILIHGKINGYI